MLFVAIKAAHLDSIAPALRLTAASAPARWALLKSPKLRAGSKAQRITLIRVPSRDDLIGFVVIRTWPRQPDGGHRFWWNHHRLRDHFAVIRLRQPHPGEPCPRNRSPRGLSWVSTAALMGACSDSMVADIVLGSSFRQSNVD